MTYEPDREQVERACPHGRRAVTFASLGEQHRTTKAVLSNRWAPLAGGPISDRQGGFRALSEDGVDAKERIAQKISKPNGEFGCWGFIGHCLKDGRGRVHLNGRIEYAHRAIYKLFVGDPGPLELDHLCRNPWCVNPAHLEPVTHRENCLRGVSPVAIAAKRTVCRHGHPLTPDNVRIVRTTGGRVCRQCIACARRWHATSRERRLRLGKPMGGSDYRKLRKAALARERGGER